MSAQPPLSEAQTENEVFPIHSGELMAWRTDHRMGSTARCFDCPRRTTSSGPGSQSQQTLVVQGLNLSKVSSSTPHLPVVMISMLVISCAPTLAALLVARFYPGAGGLRSVTRQVRTWRVPFIWYVIALIMPIVLLLLAETLSAVRRGTLPSHWMISPSFAGAGGLYFVIFGSLFAEEPGWRGFAQPRRRRAAAPWRPASLSGSFGAHGTCGT
jgi:hypothetical protein